MDWSQGFRKVSHKARRGKRRWQVHPHRSHRKAGNQYEREVAAEMRHRVIEMLAAELDAEIREADS
jgi:hypothetical protein